MKHAMAIAVGGLMCLAAACQQRSAAQDAGGRPVTPTGPDRPRPAGDAVSPKAGEKKGAADAPGATPSGERAPAASAGVRTLRLPEMQYELPPGPGRATVVVMCATCHTTRYIMIQPPLSRETWVSEVTKMQKTFGAPIPDDKTGEIVEYLVSVRGPQSNPVR
jgi:hypothetical protein